ncbi:plasma-membrane choline transporter-domain-containing protein [Epithele typhae]|uniref:plasma-membrane choline transporter-domain-containing protein n=1 Tax=Epithele typhae TaxID=378194 RepID=UPI0020073413|nr:plasma-membrane choline transporter-domain-containing protein [Epithele typhae]KAH9931710.1 plasma-membrane choline transporter-domain-containing protein [Epithele typhae]
MAASFAAYASQFLNRQQTGASSLSSSQPLFYSFSTDNGSHAGNLRDADLDDLDDPHLHTSNVSRATVRRDRDTHRDDEDDPYLRLDEDDPRLSRHQAASIPLLGVSDAGASKGWLAHASPLRSPSPSPSNSSSDSAGPPPDILHARAPSPHHTRPPQATSHQPLPPPRTSLALSLTESLLPRDGRTRPVDVFSLPDPRYVPRNRRKFNDSTWTAVWLAGVGICLFSSILSLFLIRVPANSSRLPYTTLLHTVPLLTILTFVSAVVCYVHIFLLRVFVKPVMIATSVFIPATLLISAVWAFVGSFMWDNNVTPTWGETWGLRLFSLVPLVLALLTGRRLLNLPRDIHTASSLLNLTTRLLMENPFLLALSPTVLLAMLLLSIPFITLAFRLLLVGFTTSDGPRSAWHVREWAHWAIAGTIGVCLWTWGVGIGLLRVTCAGVIGAWYFSDPSLPPTPPASTHTIHAALMRSSQPSIGTIVLSALIVTSIRIMGLLILALRALPAYLPPYMRIVTVGAGMAVSYLESANSSLSTYALIYTGLTGDAFFPSARRSHALTGAVESASLANYRRRFKTEPPLTLLTVAPLTLTFPFALITYLFVAHTLGAPDSALSASLLAGGVTALVGVFCIGLVKDTADALYICYCIDKEAGERRREEVFASFEYENRHRAAQTSQSRAPPAPQYPHPHPRESRRQPLPTSPPPEDEDEEDAPFFPHQRTPQRAPAPQRREPTPDPFEADPSPSELEVGPQGFLLQHDPYASSGSRMPLSQRHLEDSEEEGGDSQMFPGSDLF